MISLLETEFIELITTPSNDVTYPDLLQKALTEFSILICQTTFTDEDLASRYNELTKTSVYLHAFQTRLLPTCSDTCKDFVAFSVEYAANLIDRQIELLNLSLKYPKSFEVRKNAQIASPFQWSDKFSKNDLMELISGLDAVEAIEHSLGGKVPFQELVSGFEMFLNMELPKAYNRRSEILSRSKVVGFLKKLIDALVQKSEK